MLDGSSTFLIKDNDLLNGWDAKFVKYLRKNEFKPWTKKGYFDGVNWIYVNINTKLFAFGLPGIKVLTPVGDHAITIDEFKKIYNIFKKYDKTNPLKMIGE